MKCPYCGAEMEKGTIQSAQEISWIKGDKKRLLANADFYEGSIVLSERSFWSGSAVVACLCRGCQKVIIDFGDERSDLNNR